MYLLPCLMLALAPSMQDTASGRSEWFQVGPEQVTIDVNSEPTPTLFDLVRACEPITGVRFYLADRSDEEALKKERVSMSPPVALRHEALYGYLQSLLRAHNFGCAPITHEPDLLVRIVRLQGEGLHAMKNSVRFVAPDKVSEYSEYHATIITTMVPLQSADPQSVTQTLTRFFSAQALEGFASYGHSQSEKRGITLIGFGPTVASLTEMVRMMDSSSSSNLPSDHVLIEVWFVPAGEQRDQVEALLKNGDVAKAWAAMPRNHDAGVQRLGRFQGQAVGGTGIEISASAQGGEEGLAASLDLMPRFQPDGRLQVEFGLEVSGLNGGSSFKTRIRGGALLEDGAHDALASSSSKGIVLLFLHRF